MSETEVIVKNVETCLNEVRGLSRDFVLRIEEDWEGIRLRTLKPVTCPNEGMLETMAFYTKVYELIKRFNKLCEVTASKLPPPVPRSANPEYYVRISVVRTVAWMVGIERCGESAFFATHQNKEEICKQSVSFNFEDDVNASSKDIVSYIREHVAAYFDTSSILDFDDMMDSVFEPRPVWWTERQDTVALASFNKKNKELGYDF